MRIVLLLCAFVIGPVVAAQPDVDHNYCGFAPNDSIDLTNDAIPDVVVQGFRIGTDDEPSSSGTCMVHVMNLPANTLLSARDGQSYWRTKIRPQGERIPPTDTTVQNDPRIPTIHYTDGSLQVAYWGHGHRSSLLTATSNLRKQHDVFRTVANGTTWHGSFRTEPPARMDDVRITVGVLVPLDQPFVVP